MKNTPKKIYLQIGDNCPKNEDFNTLNEVTWCADPVNENDIEYELKKTETRLSFEELKAATLKFKATSEYQQVMIVILRKIFEEHETKNSLKN